ncbi:MAG: M20/M25/M40 family metallo-hydrolase [Candidatus Aenigmarchaeota archaeon]|nr:M20/M25/M40 family metallo-hydrolase [Candidatus Aenigmarchaeota archaeon]
MVSAAAIGKLGGEEFYRFYKRIVETDTTNMEDISRGIVLKKNYIKCSKIIAAQCRSLGMETTIFEPVREKIFKPIDKKPRPNVIADIDNGKKKTVLILSHYDVVPVPKTQKWNTNPFKLVFKNGKFFARGSSDDKGSGVLCTLAALSEMENIPVNVRAIFACDEETQGSGGLESIKIHDRLNPKDKILAGDLALLPDGDPHVSGGSSGVVFGDIEFNGNFPVFLKFLKNLIAYKQVREKMNSVLSAPDWPSSPSRKITGRFTVTKLFWASKKAKLSSGGNSNNTIPDMVLGKIGSGKIEILGKGGHAGLPHCFKNPIELSIPVMEELKIAESGTGRIGFDMRLIPEEDPNKAFRKFLGFYRSIKPSGAKLTAPPERRKHGYFLKPKDPAVVLLKKSFESVTGKKHKVLGDYGGSDATSFIGLKTPDGKPLKALLFGSEGKGTNIHGANENAPPSALRKNMEIIKWLLRNSQFL